jgi:hypothetical protein
MRTAAAEGSPRYAAASSVVIHPVAAVVVVMRASIGLIRSAAPSGWTRVVDVIVGMTATGRWLAQSSTKST